MERWAAPTLRKILSARRRRKSGAAGVFDSPDGRWALASTSITAVVAGAVAWLAAGAAPQSTAAAYDLHNNRSLLPYQVFMNLTSHGHDAKATYAAFTPSAELVTRATGPSRASSALDNALTVEQLNDNTDSGIDNRTVTLEKGDTLAGALTGAGVSVVDAHAAIAALRKVYDPRQLRSGQSFQLSFAAADQSAANSDSQTPARLLAVSFSPELDHAITVRRSADGTFSARDVQKDLVAHYHRAGGRIDSSLYLAAMQAGIPANIVVQMIHIFSYQVDFQRDIHPGDTFQVLYSNYATPDGRSAKTGDIEYATMTLGGKAYTLYRYQPKGSDVVDYLDGDGRSAKSLLMRTPVDGARISSGFGMRFHPILGYTRMHKGVDFAVPVGTPVMAAGSGVIRFEGREHGYGNFLLIKHNREYSTAYAHLSRFARGVHIGSHVVQGQIVAYSGNTGLTTGPHLHYEVRVYGKQVNPMTVKIAHNVRLKGKALQAFLVQKLHIDSELASLPLETKMADNSTGLRAAKD